MTTIAQILSRTWQEMEQKSSSNTYSRQRLLDMYNELGKEITQGRVANELTGKFIQCNIFKFNTAKFWITKQDPIVLQWDITTSSTEILLDTTKVQDEWAILIGDEVIEYTSKDATKIMWCTWILLEHKTGESITVLNLCPEDFWKPTMVYSFYNGKRVELRTIESNIQLNRYYDIYNVGANTYLSLYGVQWNSNYYIEYIKVREDAVEDTEVSIFPQKIALDIIPFICGWRLNKDDVLRAKLLNQGYNKLSTECANQGDLTGKPKGIWRHRFWFSSIN